MSWHNLEYSLRIHNKIHLVSKEQQNLQILNPNKFDQKEKALLRAIEFWTNLQPDKSIQTPNWSNTPLLMEETMLKRESEGMTN